MPAMPAMTATVSRRRCLAWLAGATCAVPHPARSATAPGSALPPVQLALDWAEHGARLDVRDFLVSEKYDGVRALWDGSVLRHRSGRVIGAPAAFTAALPPFALDGELWLGRGRFDALSALVRRRTADAAAWRGVRYQVFDQPLDAAPFAVRHERLGVRLASIGPGPVALVEQRRIGDRRGLAAWLDRVTAAGGEGLVLHRADAPVRPGRSTDLLKLKRERDAEATVVGHVPGRGRLQGSVGALEVETEEGLRFRLGSGLDDALRADPPPIGSVVTYRYRDVTPNGTPRFATYWRAYGGD